MLKRFYQVLGVLIGAAILFSSCKNEAKFSSSVPKDAAVVVHFNSAEMNKKLPWAEVKNTEWFQEAIKDTATSAFVKAMMENPENSGVDINSDLLFYVMKDSLGGYVAFQGNVKDAEKFKAFSAQLTKVSAPEVKDGLSFYNGAKTISVFDNSRFSILLDAPEMKKLDDLGSTNSLLNDSATVAPVVASVRDMKVTAVAAFNLKKDNSMAGNKRFNEVFSEKGDMHFWFSMDKVYSNSWGGAAMSMFNFSKLYKETAYGGTVNFDNGKITADTKSYSNKEVTDLMKKYEGSNLDESLLKRMPSDNIAGAMAFNIKPQFFAEIFKLAGLDGMLNMGLAMAGLNMDDIIKATKGDMAFAMTDVKQDSIMGVQPSVVFAAKIGDKVSFDKLINAFKSVTKGDDKVAMDSKDGVFAFGSSKEVVAKYLSSTGDSKNAMISKIGGNPMGGFVDLQNIFTAMQGKNFTDSLDKVAFDASKKFWENVVMSGGNMKGDAMTAHFEVNLLDKNTNSLKSLNSYMNEIAKIEALKKKRDGLVEEPTAIEVMPDTTTVTAPVGK